MLLKETDSMLRAAAIRVASYSALSGVAFAASAGWNNCLYLLSGLLTTTAGATCVCIGSIFNPNPSFSLVAEGLAASTLSVLDVTGCVLEKKSTICSSIASESSPLLMTTIFAMTFNLLI